MRYKILIIYIILYFIYFLNLSQSQLSPINQVTTLSIKNINYLDKENKYQDYPYYSNGETCKFQLFYLVNDNKTDISLNQIETLYTSNINASASFIKKDKSSAIIKVDISELNSVQVDTEFSFVLSVVSTLTNIVNYNITLKCNPIPITVGFFMSNSFSLSVKDGVFSYLRILNVPGLFEGELSRQSNFRVDNYGNNLFLLHWSNSKEIFNFYNDQIFIRNLTFPIEVPSCFTDYGSNYINFVYGSNYIQQIGYNLKPFIEIKVNSSLIRPYLLFTVNDTVRVESNFIPLYGQKGLMTYSSSFTDAGVNIEDSRIHYLKSFFSDYKETIFSMVINKFIPYSSSSPAVISYSKRNPLVQMLNFEFLFYGNQFNYFYTTYADLFLNMEYPLGYNFGNNNQLSFSFSFPFIFTRKFESLAINVSVGTINNITINNNSTSNDFKGPQVKSYEFIIISGFIYVLKMNVVDESGISSITNAAFQTSKNIGDSLVSGDIYDGNFEFIVNLNSKFQDLILTDVIGNSQTISIGDYLSLEPSVIQFKIPSIIGSFYIPNYNSFNFFSNITFKENDVDVSINPSYNTVYFTPVPLFITNKPFEFILKDPISKGTVWPVFWDASIGKFVCDFILPKNNLFGQIEYDIRFSDSYILSNYQFSPSFQLRVNDNTYLDNSGPIFSSISSFINSDNNITITQNGGAVVWILTISESSGFSHGYIKVVGSIDNSIYHFNFTNLDCIGNLVACTIRIEVKINSPCINQYMVIHTVILTDKNDISSYFEIYPKPEYSSITANPFKLLLKNEFINRVSYTCDITFTDSTSVTLNSFNITTSSNSNTIDVGLSDENQRTITINFNATQAVSGIQVNQLPIVYIIDQRLKMVQGTATLMYTSSKEFNASYQCNIILPLGFGYPGPLHFSVYGLLSKGGIFYGQSTYQLQNKNYSYYLNTTLSIDSGPTILSNGFITSKGGNLLIYGKGFKNISNTWLKYLDQEPNGEFILSSSTTLMSTVLQINDIGYTTKPYIVMLENNNGIKSNQHTVYPVYFNTSFETPIPIEPTEVPTSSNPVTPTPSPSDSPTPSQPSTPPPQKCYGNPVCGGPSKGYCEPLVGCICFSPNIGTACESTIIIIPQPSTNNSEPTILIPVSPSDSNQILYKSLISIVGLRELDYMNNQVSLELFDKWEYNQLTDTKNQYTTTTTSSNTLITVTLEWFENESIINFANINLTMHPSTIKYTIHLSEYEFQNNLNTLQLIMSASISNDGNTNHCSSKQFSSINNIDSNYMKLKIDNYSLYGRFIKRAQLNDSKIIAIENQLLDSSFNSLPSTTSSESRSQSYIAISIPNYKNSITIDPDFSVLIDSQNAKDDENSICKTSNGLKGTQIAGIVIGSVAFATIIAVSIGYYIYKKKSYAQMMKNVAQKLNKIND